MGSGETREEFSYEIPFAAYLARVYIPEQYMNNGGTNGAWVEHVLASGSGEHADQKL